MDVLVIQGAGMDMRGLVQIDVFGPTTLDEINDLIGQYAVELGIDVDIFQTNVEGEAVNRLYQAHRDGIDAAIVNPAGYTTIGGLLAGAIAQVRFPVLEVHTSNPASRGINSVILPRSAGSVTGLGTYGYYLALAGLKRLVLGA